MTLSESVLYAVGLNDERISNASPLGTTGT